MFERLFRFIDFRLRKFFFPTRHTHLANQRDVVLKRDSSRIDEDGRMAELELETRAWFREFWSRSVVAWLALLISCIALTVSVCTFYRSLRFDHGTAKSQQTAPAKAGPATP